MAAPMKTKDRADRLAELLELSAKTMGEDQFTESEASEFLTRIDDATKRVVARALADKAKGQGPREPS